MVSAKEMQDAGLATGLSSGGGYTGFLEANEMFPITASRYCVQTGVSSFKAGSWNVNGLRDKHDKFRVIARTFGAMQLSCLVLQDCRLPSAQAKYVKDKLEDLIPGSKVLVFPSKAPAVPGRKVHM
ncbi:MAG: hypothetical protein ACK559_31215, partial [bacterium]